MVECNSGSIQLYGHPVIVIFRPDEVEDLDGFMGGIICSGCLHWIRMVPGFTVR